MLTLPVSDEQVGFAALKLHARSKAPTAPWAAAALSTATFAAGCFWSADAAFSALPGVVETLVGYEGGTFENPTFRDVCAGDTGHAEVVQVTYNPRVTTYGDLLDLFWRIHDPTSQNRHGYDVGPQYRSRIFVHTREQERQARASRDRLTACAAFHKAIVTEIEPATTFYRAEEYHQHHFARARLLELAV
jgi:peptide-methionine (S)-S-oxide reductase